jgi:excisionase family DNA binding protein
MGTMDKMIKEGFITAKDAAIIAGYTTANILTLAKKRKLHHYKVGGRYYFKREDLDTLVNEFPALSVHGGPDVDVTTELK